MKSKILICILAFIVALAGAIPAGASCLDDAESIFNFVIEYNLKQTGASDIQEWIDTELSANAGESSEWYIIALSRSGDYDFSEYEKALSKYLAENEVNSASSRQKYALALLAADSKNPYIGSVLESSVGEQGLMSLVFGLHLMNNGVECGKYSLSEVKKELLSLQLSDGGWAVAGGYSDVDATAMTIQALAPYYNNEPSVTSAVNSALAFLSERQNNAGDYSSYGIDNPESTAQVLVALCSLGIDAETDSRFVKNGNTLLDGIEKYQLANGSFCHKEGEASNSTATVQAFYSSAAYRLLKENGGLLYVFSNSLKEQESETVTVAVSTAKAAETSALSAAAQTEPLEASSTAETTVSQIQADTAKPSVSYKTFACIIIFASAVLVCIILGMKKSLNKKNFLFVTVISVICIVFVLLTDFKSANNSTDAVKQNICGNVSISIRCDTVKNENSAHIPENGIILDKTEFELESGETVYDILCEAAGKNGIHLEVNGSGKSVYVEGIGNIYEFDFGDLSGWMYYVNGNSPSVGCGEYILSPNDKIEWHYSCSLGKDVVLN